jgi:hypothetical protein
MSALRFGGLVDQLWMGIGDPGSSVRYAFSKVIRAAFDNTCTYGTGITSLEETGAAIEDWRIVSIRSIEHCMRLAIPIGTSAMLASRPAVCDPGESYEGRSA